jgi:hypothetical protein
MQRTGEGVWLMPPNCCPACGYTLDAHGDLTDDSPCPQSGDLTVCMRCVEVLCFTEHMGVRRAMQSEYADNAEVIEMQARIRAMHRQVGRP